MGCSVGHQHIRREGNNGLVASPPSGITKPHSSPVPQCHRLQTWPGGGDGQCWGPPPPCPGGWGDGGDGRPRGPPPPWGGEGVMSSTGVPHRRVPRPHPLGHWVSCFAKGPASKGSSRCHTCFQGPSVAFHGSTVLPSSWYLLIFPRRMEYGVSLRHLDTWAASCLAMLIMLL